MPKSYQHYIEEIDIKVEGIIKSTLLYMGHLDPEYVRKSIWDAYEYSKEAHKNQVRLSGEPYINHPVEATKILLTLRPDLATIQACFLHDVIEDTPCSEKDILEKFGSDVAFLCSGMEKLTKVKYRGEERAIGSLRKMFIAMAEDLRVVFIKLADRLHNMQTLHHHPNAEKRKRIAEETLNIYAPIAGRLGLFLIKNNLEEACFEILHFDDYQKIKRELTDIKQTKKAFQDTAVYEMKKILDEIGIENKVDFRVKSPYSIYQKLQRKGFHQVSDLYDIYGVRIVVPTVADCYRVLGEIHSRWHTLPYRFKDYIALPKPNGYKSLHTTVIGFLRRYTEQPTEIQIRTSDMHVHSEIGIAAHFEYKEKGSQVATDIDWVTELKELAENIENSELMPTLSIDTFKHRIYVFTPKGDAINLPSGSTPVDFAYHLHTDLGDHIAIAKVNHTVVPLDKELHNGDIIEVIIDKNRKPSHFWLSSAKTAKAKAGIKAFLRKGDKDQHRERGKEIMNKYLEKSGLEIFDKDFTVLKVLDGREMNIEERLQLLEQVGNFSINPASLLRRILREKGIRHVSKSKKTLTQKLLSYFEPGETETNLRKEIIIGGEKGISYRVCQDCCEKTIPDQIVAHINAKGIFTVHKRNCKVLKGVNRERLLPAFIEGSEDTTMYFTLKIFVKNKIGVLKTISETLFSMGINIDEIHTKKMSQQETRISLSIEIHDYEYLIIDRFIERVQLELGEYFLEYHLEETKQ